MKCPNCGKELKENNYLYSCENCDLKFWKRVFNREMTDAEMEQLLNEGKLPYLNGFKKKDGSSFGARLKLDDDFKVIPYWEPGDGVDPELKCPICGKPMKQNSKGLSCTGWKEGCNMTIWNSWNGYTLTDSDKKALIKGEEIGPVEVTGKYGDYKAKLKLNDEHKIVAIREKNK